MNDTTEKKRSFSKSDKVKIVIASTLTASLVVAIPVYAWFGSQRKAAELHKIKYPNALFLNAAYREDQVYFGLDTVDISDVERDHNGDPITYTNDLGQTVTHPISELEYVFSVSGSNTDTFDLQLAHTNNNKFTYEIYIATPVTSSAYNALSSSEKNACIAYETHPGKNTENTSLEITNDLIPDNEGYVYFSYGSKLEGEAVIEDEAQDINGKYVNNKDNTFKLAKSKTDNDYYYTQTYGTYANVQSLSVPLYWQAHDLPTSLGSDAVSNKQDFCRYFILKVTWDRNEQARQETKESDMVYLSIERSS